MRDRVPASVSGIPLGIMMSVLSHACLGRSSLETVAYTVCSGHVAYCVDRMLDDKVECENHEILAVLLSACVSCGVLFGRRETMMAIPLQIAVVPAYAPFKKAFPLLKPLYVSGAWMTASVLLPSLMLHASPDLPSCLSMTTMLWAESNRMDGEDVDEDSANGVMTLATRIGKRRNDAVSDGASAMAVALALLSGGTDGRLVLAASAAAPLARRLCASRPRASLHRAEIKHPGKLASLCKKNAGFVHRFVR